MGEFRETWTGLLKNRVSSKFADEFYLELKKQYSFYKRHYHNLNHIEYMLDLAIKFKDQITDIDTLLFSIFYHDIIYKVSRKDNELKSAELATERLKSIDYPEENIKRCFDQIMATASHKTQKENDTNYLLDFDLGVLGDSEEKYV